MSLATRPKDDVEGALLALMGEPDQRLVKCPNLIGICNPEDDEGLLGLLNAMFKDWYSVTLVDVILSVTAIISALAICLTWCNSCQQCKSKRRRYDLNESGKPMDKLSISMVSDGKKIFESSMRPNAEPRISRVAFGRERSPSTSSADTLGKPSPLIKPKVRFS